VIDEISRNQGAKMRLTVFHREGGGVGVGLVLGEEVLDLAAADVRFAEDLAPLIALGDGLKAAIDEAAPRAPRLPLAAIRHALPLARPPKVICLGLNYADHAKEGGYDVPDYPSLFMRSMTSMVAAGEPLERPRCSERFDYEAELMVVIGKGGRHIKKGEAFNHVFGYTLFNDGSIRDFQRKATQWTPGKNFDRSGAIGPVVVTPDELPEGCKGLAIRSILNGLVMQSANTDDMLFPVAETFEIITEYCTLEPGDLIAMGTPPGVGHARKPPVWMKAGDRIEIEVEKIGLLRNEVVDEPAS
jgi:2-keto-4-pentenoate hydratase/2-oxohepta-3-ene-1,7-dioic acid hydratase in catechol pathway